MSRCFPPALPPARISRPAPARAVCQDEAGQCRMALRPRAAWTRTAAAVATALASACMMPGQASAAAEPASTATLPGQQRYDIPAGPLRTVLTRFASLAGIYLAGSIELANGKTSPGLQGNYTAEQGLAQVLAGTGLQAVPDANRRYVLKPLPPASAGVSEMPAVTVTGQVESGTGPVVGYMAQRSVTATKTDTPIVETPQSISVVTANQIRDTASNTLDQALTYSAGVRTSIYGASSRMDTAQARGVEIEDIFLDGLKDRERKR